MKCMDETTNSDRELLIRIDERLKDLMIKMDQMKSDYASKSELQSATLLLKEELVLLKRIVYGGCGFILLTFLGTLMKVFAK